VLTHHGLPLDLPAGKYAGTVVHLVRLDDHPLSDAARQAGVPGLGFGQRRELETSSR
jgi:hypothetical protein